LLAPVQEGNGRRSLADPPISLFAAARGGDAQPLFLQLQKAFPAISRVLGAIL